MEDQQYCKDCNAFQEFPNKHKGIEKSEFYACLRLLIKLDKDDIACRGFDKK